MSAPEGAATNGTDAAGDELAASVVAFARAVAADLDLLADCHDREPDAAAIAALQAASLEEQFGIVLKSERGRQALEAAAKAIAVMPTPVDQATLDELAVGYADVYLRHYYRVAPTESVWLSDEGLEQQAPMFEVRERYLRHGLRVADGAGRPDDHLVIELQYVAHLLAHADDAKGLEEPARFLDDHLLRWFGSFAERLVAREAPEWFAALALVTATYLDEVRDHLAEITGIARPAPKTEAEAATPAGRRAKPKVAPGAETGEAERPYVPGISPSW